MPSNVNGSALSRIDKSLAFDIASFQPFIPTVVPQLLSLVSELDTLGGKKRVMGCLITVITESETRVCFRQFRSQAESS